MTFTQILDIGIRVTGISSLLLILGAIFFESFYHKIDLELKYTGKGKRILNWIAIFIDKNINHTSGGISYILWCLLLWRLNHYPLLIIWSSSMALIYIIVGFLKRLSKKKRPIDARITLSDFSFPSGHTALATTGFLNLGLLFSLSLSLFLSVLGIFSLAIFGGMVVGRSRLYLRVHRISDVLVGLLLGIFCFLIACSLVLG